MKLAAKRRETLRKGTIQGLGAWGALAICLGPQLKTATKTAALTNDVDLIPYIGIEAGAAAAEAIDVHWTSISRHVYE